MISTSQLSFKKTAIFVASSAITVWVLTGCANFGSSNSNTNPSVAPPGMSSSVTSATKPDAVIIKNSAKWADEQRKSCDKYYPGAIQAGIRRSCYVGGALVDRYNGWAPRVSESGCRLQYGEEPTETYACLIGTKIANQLANTQTKDALEKQGGQKPFLASLQSCSEIYSVRTDLDTYLLESCLTGIHANSFMPNLDRFEICRQITPERSFIGPCSVGASLNSSDSIPTSDHRIQCEKYFDHLRFHQAYRSCLNAKAVNPENDDAITLDPIKPRCYTIVSDNGNDHERGACINGAVLLENKRRGLSSSIFDGCGVNQVRYEDRDVLGCLAAGSFLSYSNSNTADRLCREIFRDRKSLARSGCLNSISALKAAPVNPNSTKQ